MNHRVGLTYLPGALPSFENFGYLPTDLVHGDGMVNGKPASEILDMIIIPGGSMVESQSIKERLLDEITKMADSGKFVLGICSGFQILSNGTDIGRLSSTPIFKKGMGLIDAEFSPLICTDQIKATIVDKSLLTEAVGEEVTGFHCHTYGKISVHSGSRPILVSHTKRLDYKKNRQDLISGISNSKGNVVGVIIHALLDQNPLVIQGITKSLDISQAELEEIRKANQVLQEKVKSEIGISEEKIQNSSKFKNKNKKTLLFTALGSGSGKTLLVTGIAGALKKNGLNVGVVKIGGDIRDVVPTLYLIKEPMRGYTSIKVGESGWMDASQAVNMATIDYDFLIIEGAMSAFTGLLNDQVKRPSSTVEIAAILRSPTVIVVGCDKEGVEGALVSTLNYVRLLRKLGVNVVGVLLNKVRTSYLNDEIKELMKQAFSNVGIEILGIVPRIDLEGRGAIPEIEIKYEAFGEKAMDLAESSIDFNKLIEMAGPFKNSELEFNELVEEFKNSILNDYMLKETDGKREE